MMENIIMATFPVESEAYQAFSELKRDMYGTNFLVSQAALVKREGGSLVTEDEFDSGIETSDDTLGGSIIGSFVGILGGPLGVLLGAGFGGLVGAAVDDDDIDQNGSIMEKVAAGLTEGTIAVIALAQENGSAAIDSRFSKYNAAVTRYDAAEVASEIEAAQKEQKKLEKEARAALRQEKSDALKVKVAERRKKIAADFDALKAKLK